jgi:outer membrane protein
MKLKSVILVLLFVPTLLFAQQNEQEKEWSLSDCIEYALSNNLQVRQSMLSTLSAQVNLDQYQAQKMPTLNASVRQNYSWSNIEDVKSGSTDFTGNFVSNYNLNSNVLIYGGKQLVNQIKQAEIDLEAGKYDSESVKDAISISILNAFIQIVYLEESVQNSKEQIKLTEDQLALADIRVQSGIISQSDYLQVKSQLATERFSLASASSQLKVSKLNLMQLMELPAIDDFNIERPDVDSIRNLDLSPSANAVYVQALLSRPEVKGAELRIVSAELDKKIASAGYLPSLSGDAGLSTAYSNLTNGNYTAQLGDRVSPTVGITLTIPIFQQEKTKSAVARAEISYQTAVINEQDTKNQLRKEIEQSCVDVYSAQIEYEASVEKYNAAQESYDLASEKFENGLINSVDFLFEKTNIIKAESELLQAKFNMEYSYKLLDFYLGKPIVL